MYLVDIRLIHLRDQKCQSRQMMNDENKKNGRYHVYMFARRACLHLCVCVCVGGGVAVMLAVFGEGHVSLMCSFGFSISMLNLCNAAS